MKSDEEWVAHFSLQPITEQDDGIRLKTSEIRAIQADALRHAAELCQKRPFTITHRTLLETSDPKIRFAIETHSKASNELMGFTVQRTASLLAQAIDAEAAKLEGPQ